MVFNSYFRYFFYVAWNWNLRLALFIIYYEAKGEKKYKVRTIGVDDLKTVKARGIDISHSSMYMPVNYFILERLMEEIKKYAGTGVFLDMGCGRGRAMIVAAYYGFKRIIGIDFSQELCQRASQAIQEYSAVHPAADFSIINANALFFEIPPEVTDIFLFNPFDEVILEEVVAHILDSIRKKPRTIRVSYANPVFKYTFLNVGFTEIYYVKKLDYFEGMILELQPGALPAI